MLILILILILILLVFRESNHIQTLSRQAARWSVAADQDESPLVRLLHANYGAGYLWALEDIATPSEIETEVGNYSRFKKDILDIQDQATKKVSQVCPQFAGDMPKFLGRLAGDLP